MLHRRGLSVSPRPVPKIGPVGINERTSPLEIRLKLQQANGLRGGRQCLTAEAPIGGVVGPTGATQPPVMAGLNRAINAGSTFFAEHNRSEGALPPLARSQIQALSC